MLRARQKPAAIKDVVMALDDKSRRAFVLSRFHNWSYNEMWQAKTEG